MQLLQVGTPHETDTQKLARRGKPLHEAVELSFITHRGKRKKLEKKKHDKKHKKPKGSLVAEEH